ncbi:YheC/YheD family protein [Evansella clarkii]|uniref:YheC/YheD family protein n=1 Tax=Evansella clarkii TaxID=79879 RepID=UPI001F1F1DC1|nr:YheC/YheD family protein [Evansella clarkii]
MRNKKNPKKFTKLVAKATKYYGIDLIYFSPIDVDIKKEVINGKKLVDGKWESIQVPPPPFIDFSSYCFKHKEIVSFLKKYSILSTGRLGSKDVVYEKLFKDGEFSHIIIPTLRTENFNEFHNFLENYGEIILKPINGQRGEGIYKLSFYNNHYTLNYNQDEKTLSKEELHSFFSDVISNKRYLLQKCINSKTKTGDPFDIRIRLEKNGEGEWEVAIFLVRIGTSNKVVSNLTQGGSVSQLTPFLKENYGDEYLVLKKHIKKIAKNLPYKLEEIFETRLTALGLDVGIDTDRSIYLFETNNAPGFEFGMGEIALLRAEHYNYILKEHNK